MAYISKLLMCIIYHGTYYSHNIIKGLIIHNLEINILKKYNVIKKKVLVH